MIMFLDLSVKCNSSQLIFCPRTNLEDLFETTQNTRLVKSSYESPSIFALSLDGTFSMFVDIKVDLWKQCRGSR